MRNTVTFFDTREDLRELTGLPGDDYDKALWDAGFDLDDWDWGFVSDTLWPEDWDGPYSHEPALIIRTVPIFRYSVA